MARAAGKSVEGGGAPRFDPARSVPILIHGDAAFPGQGVVAETLNLQPAARLLDRRHHPHHRQQSARVHDGSPRISTARRTARRPCARLQDSDRARECRRSRSLCSKRRGWPSRTGSGSRQLADRPDRYHRYGHNEGDEPAFTQPLMYTAYRGAADGARDLGAHAGRAGATSPPSRPSGSPTQHVAAMQGAVQCASARAGLVEPEPPGAAPSGRQRRPHTAVPLERLRELNAALLDVPANFTIHKKLERGRDKRARMLEAVDERSVDWAAAEELALASILSDGTAIRLTGEDVERGTFSHRHAVYHDVKTGRAHVTATDAAAGRRSLRDSQQPAVRNAVIGFGVRLQHSRSHAPGDVGSHSTATSSTARKSSSTSSWSQRATSGANAVAGDPPAAWLTKVRDPTTRRASRAFPAACRRHQHARRELYNRRAVFPLLRRQTALLLSDPLPS